MVDNRKRAITEYSARLGVSARRLELIAAAVTQLDEPELKLLEDWTRLVRSTQKPVEVRRELAKGLRDELERLWTTPLDSDPLAGVDEPLSLREAASAALWADTSARMNRGRLLAECVSASEAGELTHRSRQAVERQRREGHLLAFRIGREWRYPVWQFDPDGPRGLLPELDTILGKLHLSPYAAALWLRTPKDELDGETPVDRLRRRDVEKVVRLAEDHGQAP